MSVYNPPKPFDPSLANLLTVGEETLPRLMIAQSPGWASQQLRLSYFTARKTEVVTQVRMITGGTAAGATPTLVRIGLYSIDGAGFGTLIAAIPSDTSLFSVTNVAYTRALSASVQKVQGQRYAAAVLIVTAAAMPSVAGYNTDLSPGGRAEFGIAPRIAGILAGQADLPATFTDASLTAAQAMLYTVFLP